MSHLSESFIMTIQFRTAAVLTLAAALLLPVLPARAAASNYSDPEQLLTDAYVAVAKADTALDGADYPAAIDLYSEALALYSDMASQFPTFKPSLVRYRNTYCQNQIAEAQARANGRTSEAPAAYAPAETPAADRPDAASAPAKTPAPPPNSADSRRIARNETEVALEIDYLKNRIAALESELSNSDTLIESLNKENADLTTTNQQLVHQLSKAQTALEARPDITAEELSALHTEIAALKSQLAAANHDLDESRELHLALDEAEAQTAELTAKLADLTAENQRLTEEIDSLEQAAIDANTTAGMASAKLAFLESELSDLRDAQSAKPAASPETSTPPPPPAANEPANPAPAPDESPVIPPTLVSEPLPDEPEPPLAEPQPTLRATVPPAQVPADTTPAAFVRQLIAAGDLQTALATVQAVRANDADNDTLALIEATILIRLEAYDDAAALLIPFAKAHPKNADIHATLGAAMLGAGDYDQARETLEVAVKLNKKLAEAHYNLALLYAFTDPVSTRTARKHYEQALKYGIAPDPSLDAIK